MSLPLPVCDNIYAASDSITTTVTAGVLKILPLIVTLLLLFMVMDNRDTTGIAECQRRRHDGDVSLISQKHDEQH